MAVAFAVDFCCCTPAVSPSCHWGVHRNSKSRILMVLSFSILEINRSACDIKYFLLIVLAVSILGFVQSVGNSKACLLIGITALTLGVKKSLGDSKACLLITIGVLLLILNSLLAVGNSLAYLQTIVSLKGDTFLSNRILSVAISVGDSTAYLLILTDDLFRMDNCSVYWSWINHIRKVPSSEKICITYTIKFDQLSFHISYSSLVDM